MADGSLRMVRAPTLELDACQLGPDSGVLARIHAICAAAPTRTIRVNLLPRLTTLRSAHNPRTAPEVGADLKDHWLYSCRACHERSATLRIFARGLLLLPMATPSWDVPEVPVGTTSVVCFNYTLDGTLCEVRAFSPARSPAGTTLSVASQPHLAAKPLRGTNGHVARDQTAECGASRTRRPNESEARPDLLRSADDAQRGGRCRSQRACGERRTGTGSE
jgi:hypothetical protein